jgi:hypothetical protein
MKDAVLKRVMDTVNVVVVEGIMVMDTLLDAL